MCFRTLQLGFTDGQENGREILKREDWDDTFAERNAKSEIQGAGIAGILVLFPVFLILAIWNPKILSLIPLLTLWIIQKRRTNRK